MIDIAKVKELVKLMVDNDLSEVDLKVDDNSVKIRRGPAGGTVVNHNPVIYGGAGGAPASVPGHAGAGVAAMPAAPMPLAATAPAPGDASRGGLIAIESPMVGTFYSAPNPDTPAFVKPGSQISPDSVVCLIEAMKVFNEIKAEKSGVVEQVLAKNGEAVEFGQKLFLVRPA